jgi:uncharacterized membrane protein
VFAIAFAGLFGLRLLQGDAVRGVPWFAALWGSIAALIAASIATYSAYRIRCRVVFKPGDQREPK